MPVREHPTWGWFETIDLSDPESQKKQERRVIFFLTPPYLPIEPLEGLQSVLKIWKLVKNASLKLYSHFIQDFLVICQKKLNFYGRRLQYGL